MLSELLPLKAGMIVALVGAGGKTTTMFCLAAERAALDERVITTTTTHIFPPTPAQTEALILATEHDALLKRAADALAQHRHITVATAPAPEGKLRGVPPEWVADLRALPGVSMVLVEADGAKGRMIKAPADHEPVIPPGTDLVLALANAEAIGQPLNDAIAHRLERVSALTGLRPGDILTPQALATLATHQQGLLKSIPPGASVVLVLTHVQPADRQSAEEAARQALASKRFAGAILCSLNEACALTR